MYKIISLVICLILLISPPLHSQSDDFATRINKLLTTVFSDLEIKEVDAYIAKIKDDKIYLDKGAQANFNAGEKLLVVRPLDLLTDPITQEGLGVIDKKIAEISITQVENNYAMAEIEKKIDEAVIKPGDKVVTAKKHLRVLLAQFRTPEKLEELASNLEGKFYSYLTRKKLFKVNSVDITDYKQLDKVEQNADYLMTGEVYENQDEIFLKVELYDNNTGLTAAEKVISFSNKDEIITYYRQKYSDKNSGYQLLFKTKQFSGPSHNLAWSNANQGVVIVNRGSDLRIMRYNNQSSELTVKDTIEQYQRTKYDDHNLVVDDLDSQRGLEIFAENYNYPLQFKESEQGYKVNALKKFHRNRPKLITSFEDKNYLVTRDYKGFLKFNFWQDDELVTDFKLEIKQDEGYRVELGDIDNNGQSELVLTSYQDKRGYRLKIYDLDYELQGEIKQNLGAEFVLADLKDDQNLEIYAYDKEDNKVIAFAKEDDSYQQIWQSKKLDAEIVDLAVGDINQDGVQELLVLVNAEEESQIYIYQYQSVD